MPRALVVGIDYAGTAMELSGCANDAHAMAAHLTKRGYAVTLLSDAVESELSTAVPPTRANILRALAELILAPDNDLVFTYSGHGAQLPDLDGDEADGLDEVLVPLDAARGLTHDTAIIDDALRGLLQMLREPQRLACILDCCHSGSGLDLKWVGHVQGGRLRLLDGGERPTPGQCVMLSGCRDDQVSLERTVRGQTHGVLTAAVLACLTTAPGLSASDLFFRVRASLRRAGEEQTPQISAGRKTRLTEPFFPKK